MEPVHQRIAACIRRTRSIFDVYVPGARRQVRVAASSVVDGQIDRRTDGVSRQHHRRRTCEIAATRRQRNRTERTLRPDPFSMRKQRGQATHGARGCAYVQANDVCICSTEQVR